MKLLVAEDDPKLLKSLVHILEHNRFSVDGVSNGEDALEYGQTGEYDGLILDIMMPGLDGLQVLQTLRRNGIKTPALFLTARTEISQRVEGLDAGADDYLPKPFSTAELLARIRAMLRRKDTYLPDLLAIGSRYPESLHLPAGLSGEDPDAQRQGISNPGNDDAGSRDHYSNRSFYHPSLGMGYECRHQRCMGPHL